MEKDKKIRVLIAEDNFLLAEDIKRILAQRGYEHAGTASNGLKAVEMTRSLKPDVVLMDIKMPKMDGLQAAEIINQSFPTPVVILTAFETKDLVIEASKVGVSAYLNKPPSPNEIDHAVIIAIARHKDLMEINRCYREISEQNEQLEQALQEIKALKGLLPICSHCKQIRDDKGYWHQIEEYISTHSETEFSHGICPDCFEKYYAEYNTVQSPDE